MGMGMGMGFALAAILEPARFITLRRAAATTLLLMACSSDAPAQAQDIDLDQVRTWLEEQFAEGFTLDGIAPAHIVLWAGPSIPDEATARSRYNALAQRVAGKPEHPERAEFEALHQALFAGGQATRIELFIAGEQSMRKSETYPSTSTPFYDTVITPDDAWSVTQNRITRVDPARGFPKESNFSGTPMTVWHMSGFAAVGGLHLMAHHRARITEIRQTGETVSAVAQSADGAYTSRIELTWDPDRAEGRVRSQEMWYTKSGDSAGSWQMGDQAYNDELGRWITTSWVEGGHPGEPSVRWAVDVIERASPKDLKRILRCPTRDLPDPMRGPVPLLFDFRHDERGRVAAMMPGVAIPEGRLPIRSQYVRTRWLAAGAAACVVMLLVVHRVWWRPKGQTS